MRAIVCTAKYQLIYINLDKETNHFVYLYAKYKNKYEKNLHHTIDLAFPAAHDGTGMAGKLWRRHAARILLGLF
jgi:hypothetical protein